MAIAVHSIRHRLRGVGVITWHTVDCPVLQRCCLPHPCENGTGRLPEARAGILKVLLSFHCHRHRDLQPFWLFFFSPLLPAAFSLQIHTVAPVTFSIVESSWFQRKIPDDAAQTVPQACHGRQASQCTLCLKFLSPSLTALTCFSHLRNLAVIRVAAKLAAPSLPGPVLRRVGACVTAPDLSSTKTENSLWCSFLYWEKWRTPRCRFSFGR